MRIFPGEGTVMRINLKRDIHINLLLTELDTTRAKKGHASTTKDGVRTLITEFKTHRKRSRIIDIWCFGAIINGSAQVVVPNSALASKTDVNFTKIRSIGIPMNFGHLCTKTGAKRHKENAQKVFWIFRE
jgi:hypothetical protein